MLGLKIKTGALYGLVGSGILGLLACTLIPAASAIVIYDNGAPDLVNAHCSDFSNDQCDRIGNNTTIVGDGFILATAQVLQNVQWWGVYANLDGQPVVLPAQDDFSVQIFDFSASTPATVPLHTFNVGDIGRVDTGDDVIVFDLYEFQVNLPDIILGPGRYLLSIIDNTPTTSDDWFWADSAQGGSSWERAGIGDPWSPFGLAEFAFNLSGEAFAVPIANSLSLLILGLVVLRYRRTRGLR